MADEMRTPSAPSGECVIQRSFFARILHRSVIVIRTTLVLFLILITLTTGAGWAANWVFPLAVLQTLGLASTGNLRGVTWEISLPDELAVNSVWIGVRDRSVHLSWYRGHQEARITRTRYFYHGPWPAGIRTWVMRRPYKLRLPDGTNIACKSISQVFFELPLLSLCLISAIYPIIVFYCGPLRLWKRRRKGWCLECGYDLKGNVSGICSECGQPTESYESNH